MLFRSLAGGARDAANSPQAEFVKTPEKVLARLRESPYTPRSPAAGRSDVPAADCFLTGLQRGSRSLTFSIYSKGYAGGLVSFRRTDCSDIGSLGSVPGFRFSADDVGSQLHVSLVSALGMMTMCERFSLVKDSAFASWLLSGGLGVWCFQLESLILAQNERWRQA